jgi:hypothetical protein
MRRIFYYIRWKDKVQKRKNGNQEIATVTAAVYSLENWTMLVAEMVRVPVCSSWSRVSGQTMSGHPWLVNRELLFSTSAGWIA